MLPRGESLKYQPTDDHWRAMASAMGLEELSQKFKSDVKQAVRLFLLETAAIGPQVRTIDAADWAEAGVEASQKLLSLLTGTGERHPDAAALMRQTLMARLLIQLSNNSSIHGNEKLNIHEIISATKFLNSAFLSLKNELIGMISTEIKASSYQEVRDDLIIMLASLFEVVTSEKATVRDDYYDTEKRTLFVRFLISFWPSLPDIGNIAPTESTINDWAKRALRNERIELKLLEQALKRLEQLEAGSNNDESAE